MKKNIVKAETLPDGASEEIGTTGLQSSFGTINEEFLVELRGEKGVKVFKEMRDNDPIVGSILFAIEMLIRGAEWNAVPNEEDNPEDQAAADFINEAIIDMEDSWEDLVCEILSMLVFGWAYFEVMFKVRMGPEEEVPSQFDDRKIGWKKFGFRSQDTLFKWEFDKNGGLLGLWQRPPITDISLLSGSLGEVFIPKEKAALFRTKLYKGNPEGRSTLRNAYRSWYFKKHIEQIEGIGIERDLTGIPIAHVPPEILASGANTEQKAVLAVVKKLVRDVKRDEQEGIVFPLAYNKNGDKLFELELLSSGGKRQFDTTKIIDRYDQRIAMTVLADFILLGHSKVGSFSLSSDKTMLFSTAIGGFLGRIATVFNNEKIPQLLRINNMPGKCKLVHGDIESRSLEEVSNYVTNLVRVGAMTPDKALESQLRQDANLPELDEDSLLDDEEIFGTGPEEGAEE